MCVILLQYFCLVFNESSAVLKTTHIEQVGKKIEDEVDCERKVHPDKQKEEQEDVYTNKQHVDVLKMKRSERINFNTRRRSAENPSQIIVYTIWEKRGKIGKAVKTET